MAKTSKVITAICFFFFLLNGAGQCEDIPGPYGLTAVIITKNDNSMLAWKLPGENKLLFVGSIYDGKENLTWTYSMKYLGTQRLSKNAASIEKGIQKPGNLYVFIDPGCGECQKLYSILEKENVGVSYIPISIYNETNVKTAATWIKNKDIYYDGKKDVELTGEDLQKVENNTQLFRWMNLDKEELPTPFLAWTDGPNLKTFAGLLTKEKLEEILRDITQRKREGYTIEKI